MDIDYSNELLEKDEKIIEHYVWFDMFIMVVLCAIAYFNLLVKPKSNSIV